MCEIAFTLGPLTIRWYGVMAALGFLTALFVINLKRKYAGMTPSQVADFMLLIVISGIVGSRVFYVIEFWGQFKYDLAEIFRIDHGGLVFYGGFICAVISIIVYCVRLKFSIVKVMDIAVPGLAFGHAMGRIGCFLNGCCYGTPTKLPWGVLYPAGSAPAMKYQGVPIHPVQLYEAGGNIIIGSILFYLAGKLKPGQNLSLYLFFYGTFRFLNEFARGDHTDFFMGLLTPAQTIGLFLIGTGICLFFYFGKRKNGEKYNV